MMYPIHKTILLVENDEASLKIWCMILEKHGYIVFAERRGEDAVKVINNKTGIDLIITGVYLGPGIDGFETVERILKIRDIPVLFLTDNISPESVEKAEKFKHYGYVIKGNGEAVVTASIKMAFRLNDANISINNKKQEIEAANEEMQAAMEELEAINQELIETQRSLIDSERKYRRLYESIRDSVVVVDMNGYIIDSNIAYQQMLGYTEEELKNFTYRDLSPDKWIEQEENVLREQLLGRGYSDLYEKELIRKDGTVIPVEMRSFLIKNESGVYTAAMGIVRNISERKKAEKEIFERELKFRTIFENAPYPISINRVSDTAYIDVNRKFIESAGIKKEEILGRRIEQIIRFTDKSDLENILNEFKIAGIISSYGISIKNRDDSSSYKLLSAFPVQINDEKCFVSITTDITELRNKEMALRKSEAEMKSLLDALIVGVGMIKERRFLRVNSYLCSLLGYEENEIVGSLTRIIYADDAEYERAGKELYGMLGREGSGISKALIRHKDGYLLDGLITLTPIDPDDASAGYCATLNDITELNRAENALRESEERFRTMIQSSTDMIFNISRSGRIIYESPSVTKILGYAPDYFIGRSPFELIHPDDVKIAVKDMDEVYRNINEGHPTIVRIKRADGEWIYIEAVGTNLLDKPCVKGVLITARDITERKKSEEILRESELRFKAIMEQSTVAMILINTEGLMINANEAWGRLWNVEKEQFIGKYNIFTDPQNGFILGYIKKAINGEPADIPEHFYDPALSGNAGEKRWLTGRVYPLKDSNGIFGNIVLILEDVTVKREAIESLRISEEKFRNIFETMTIGFFRTGLDGRIIDLNPACLRMFGFSTVEEARTYLNDSTEGVYADGSDWIFVRESMISGMTPFTASARLKRKDGTSFRGGINMKIIKTSDGTPLYIEGLIEDVTERLRTQEMLIQSEKMITIAGLAAGMAHEINNPLGIIMQNAENAIHRLLDDLPGNIDAALSLGTTLDKIQEYIRARRIDRYLASIREAGERAAKIVGNMLQFSRGTESKIAPININYLLDKALDLASNDYDLRKKYDFKNILVTKHYDELPDIECAETPIEQVFLNLFKNSAQAMSGYFQKSGKIPEIIIKTVNLKNYVRIEISDNGPGMEESVRKRIFEPFYSTKEPGVGTGLGLSVSYYIIVEGHGGTITVESSSGAGTRFIITLPVHRGN